VSPEAAKHVGLPSSLFHLSGVVGLVSFILSLIGVFRWMALSPSNDILMPTGIALLIMTAGMFMFKGGSDLRRCQNKGLVIVLAVVAILWALYRAYRTVEMLRIIARPEVTADWVFYTALIVAPLGALINAAAGIMTFLAISKPAVKEAFDEQSEQ